MRRQTGQRPGGDNNEMCVLRQDLLDRTEQGRIKRIGEVKIEGLGDGSVRDLDLLHRGPKLGNSVIELRARKVDLAPDTRSAVTAQT